MGAHYARRAHRIATMTGEHQLVHIYDETGPRLRMRFRIEAGTASVELLGKLDVASIDLLFHRASTLLELDLDRVVIDLRRLEFLDAAGAAALGRLAERAAELDETLVLREAPPVVQKVLDRCGLAAPSLTDGNATALAI